MDVFDFSGVEAVMSFFQHLIYELPPEVFMLLTVVFWLYVTLAVIKVMSFKDG